MSWFAYFEKNVVAEFVYVANAYILITHVGRDKVLAVCSDIVQIWLWWVLGTPVWVMIWVVLMHCALRATVSAGSVFVAQDTSCAAEYRSVMLLFVDSGGDFAS
jgi:hypothetical protein